MPMNGRHGAVTGLLVAVGAPLGYDPAMPIAEYLQAWRVLRGASVEELADRCGLAADLLVEIESGLVDPSVSIVATIASAIGVPAPWLYTDPKQLELLRQHSESDDDGEPNLGPDVTVDPVVDRILHARGQDRTLFALVAVLIEAGDLRLMRAAEVSLRSLVKQVKPVGVPWLNRQSGNFEPPSD